MKVLALAFLFSAQAFAATTPKVVGGQCTVAETREVVRLHNLDPKMHFGKFAEADTKERMHIQLVTDQFKSYAVNLWGGVSGANTRIAKKAKGERNAFDFIRSVNSPNGKRRVVCHLVIVES